MRGDVVASVRTGDYTNQNGLTIPLSFTIEVFLPAMASDDHVRRRYIGSVTNIGGLSLDETFRPPIFAMLRVRDSRFRYRSDSHQVNEINYKLLAKEEWKSTNNANLQREFLFAKQSSRTRRFKPGYHTKIRLAGVATFLLISIVIPMIVYRRLFKGKEQISVAKTI